jgi:hypothetical protein
VAIQAGMRLGRTTVADRTAQTSAVTDFRRRRHGTSRFPRAIEPQSMGGKVVPVRASFLDGHPAPSAKEHAAASLPQPPLRILAGRPVNEPAGRACGGVPTTRFPPPGRPVETADR